MAVSPEVAFNANVLVKIRDADDAFTQLGIHHDKVRAEEATVQELKIRLDKATKRLDDRRQEFDWVREKALEFCPALETGYGATPLTETVGIVDGRVTVVPIESVKRDHSPSSMAEEAG